MPKYLLPLMLLVLGAGCTKQQAPITSQGAPPREQPTTKISEMTLEENSTTTTSTEISPEQTIENPSRTVEVKTETKATEKTKTTEVTKKEATAPKSGASVAPTQPSTANNPAPTPPPTNNSTSPPAPTTPQSTPEPTPTPTPEPTPTPTPEAPAIIVREFTLTAKQFSFEPAVITVNKGDIVKITLQSIDVTHGFALPEFGVNTTLEPNTTKAVQFTADKAGTFSFFCSVFCGSNHSGMTGTLIVK